MNREMFKVYKKKVVVNINGEDKEFELLPLSGRFYGKLMSLFTGKDFDNGDVPFNGEDFGVLHELVFETLKFSFNVTDKSELEDLDLFVTQNLVAFIPALLEVNGLSNQG